LIVLAGAAMCWSGSTWAASLAGSDAARHWDQLHDARLVHAADGTPEVAARLYEELLENLGPGDPMRAEVNYWLGRARLELDDLDGAARALSTASKDEAIGPRARALLSVTESRRRQVEKLPARWTFESGTHNLVRGGTRRPSGELAIRRAGEAVALAWPTEVEDGDPDALVVGLGPGVTFRAFEARARSTQFPAVLRLLALDSTGRRWASPVIAVPADRWVDIEVALADLAALDGRSPPLRRADRLALEDVTASASGDRGANVVLLDYVAIR
jgi:hypothetical protein